MEPNKGSSWKPILLIVVVLGCILALFAILAGWFIILNFPHKVALTPDVPMVRVPVGEFTMGSDTGNADEKPAHKIVLNSFYMDKYEVTNAAYKVCVDASACAPPMKVSSSTHQDYFGNLTFANYPVVNIYWAQAERYCLWRGGRLPTEAEWEKAARGVDGRIYPWGNTIDCKHANYLGCVEGPSSVFDFDIGQSPYGVYGMAGNVWEWVSTLYKPYPYSAIDGREDLNANGARVVRGGSWKLGATEASSIYRAKLLPIAYDDNTGFRCARDATP